MRAFRTPFSLVLPALDLMLWAILALIPMTLYYGGFLQDARDDRHAITVAQHKEMNVTPEEVARQQLEVAMEGRSRWLVALNAPGMLVEAASSLRTSWPESWHPEALELGSWRALVYPVYALPAWWLAGVCVDGLLGRRRVPGAVAVIALLVVVAGGVVAGIAGLALSARGDGMSAWLLAGWGGWAVVFCFGPLAWWRQPKRLGLNPAKTGT